MKTVSFVDRLTFEFKGNVAQNAVCLGDVDNDGEHELVVGSASGDMAVFKASSSKPVMLAKDLGHITALCIGDLFNFGSNILVVISADGFVNLFDFNTIFDIGLDRQAVAGSQTTADVPCPAPKGAMAAASQAEVCSLAAAKPVQPETEASEASPGKDQEQVLMSLESVCSGGQDEKRILMIQPTYCQRLPPNIKSALIDDVNCDGRNELLVTLTDRVVRTYKWHYDGNIATPGNLEGQLIPLNKWEFAAQVGTTTTHQDDDGRRVLLVAQPGGSFIKLRPSWGSKAKKCRLFTSPRLKAQGASAEDRQRPQSDDDADEEDEEEDKDEQGGYRIMPVPETALTSMVRNFNVTTEILGNIRIGSGGERGFAMATLEGNLMLANKDGQVLCHFQLEEQLFCLRKLDLRKDGSDCVAVSSWEGKTYMIDADLRLYEFVFEESVSAFTCGSFDVQHSGKVPVLVYVTCNERIFVYYDIDVSRCKTLLVADLVHLPDGLALGSQPRATPDLIRFLLHCPPARAEQRPSLV